MADADEKMRGMEARLEGLYARTRDIGRGVGGKRSRSLNNLGDV